MAWVPEGPLDSGAMGEGGEQAPMGASAGSVLLAHGEQKLPEHPLGSVAPVFCWALKPEQQHRLCLLPAVGHSPAAFHHRVLEWFELERTLKIVQFQPVTASRGNATVRAQREKG